MAANVQATVPVPDSGFDDEQPPPQPARPTAAFATGGTGPSEEKQPLSDGVETQKEEYGDDIDNPVHYTRDPHRLIAYLVPFPEPDIEKKATDTKESIKMPERFLIYTPPPPPIPAPREGEKEAKMTKIQRKWQNEIREAKTTDAKATTWKGAKSRAMKGIDKAMGWTTSSSIDFLSRVPQAHAASSAGDQTGVDPASQNVSDTREAESTEKTVGLQEMVLIYPNTLQGTQEELRTEFVESMMRSKTKAQRDAVIATGLLPVGLAVDILATVVWPFGGLAQIDAVWGYSSMRGAKTARNVTKRLNSSGPGAGDDPNQHDLRLSFVPSARTDVLRNYLHEQCHRRDARLWRSAGVPPTEADVIDAIGWSPSTANGETQNWEDERWELAEVKEDLKSIMSKGAKEWEKWCKAFQKDPEKAMKK